MPNMLLRRLLLISKNPFPESGPFCLRSSMIFFKICFCERFCSSTERRMLRMKVSLSKYQVQSSAAPQCSSTPSAPPLQWEWRPQRRKQTRRFGGSKKRRWGPPRRETPEHWTRRWASSRRGSAWTLGTVQSWTGDILQIPGPACCSN